MKEFNKTLEKATKLIPELNSPPSKIRSKRALLPFVGDLSKSIFGTATYKDVKRLAAHINYLHDQDKEVKSAFHALDSHMQSAMFAIDSRITNSFKAIEENHQALTEMNEQTSRVLQTVMQGILLAARISRHEQLANNVLRHIEEIYQGVQNLVQGKLSPALLPPELITEAINNTEQTLAEHFPQFRLLFKNPHHFYSMSHFAFARIGLRLYVTIQFPISATQNFASMYRITTFPVPINSSSNHATQLINFPPHIIISANGDRYNTATEKDIAQCIGSNPKLCQVPLPMLTKTRASCPAALFFRDKERIHETCDFRLLPNGLEASLKPLQLGQILITRIQNITIHCPENTYRRKGCQFCTINLQCGCGISGSGIFLNPHIVGCNNTTRSTSQSHPVNLAVLQEFFLPEELESITGETVFDNPVEVSIPDFKIFKHNFTDLIAGDREQHLSLQRAAAAAKADDYIFESVADPILDGRLPELDTIWSIVVKYLSLTTASVTTILTLIVVWQFYKIRTLTVAVAVLQHSSPSNALPNTHPPLHYHPDNYSPTESTVATADNSADEHFIYLALGLALIMFLYYLIKRARGCTTTLIVEITNGSSCVRIPIKSLSTCPRALHCTALGAVKHISVERNLWPKVTIDWGDFELTKDGLPIKLPKMQNISFWHAWILRKILNQPFLANILLAHKGLASPAKFCHPDGCNCQVMPTAPLYPKLSETGL